MSAPALSAWVQWVDASGRPTPVFLTYMLGHDSAIASNGIDLLALKLNVANLAQAIADLSDMGAPRWGTIGGILADQPDLKAALDTKPTIGQALAFVNIGW